MHRRSRWANIIAIRYSVLVGVADGGHADPCSGRLQASNVLAPGVLHPLIRVVDQPPGGFTSGAYRAAVGAGRLPNLFTEEEPEEEPMQPRTAL